MRIISEGFDRDFVLTPPEPKLIQDWASLGDKIVLLQAKVDFTGTVIECLIDNVPVPTEQLESMNVVRVPSYRIEIKAYKKLLDGGFKNADNN